MDDEVMDGLAKHVEERRRESTSVPKPWPPEDRVARRWVSQGMDCCVLRGHVALCGYVKVPVGHPAHGKYYDDVDVSIHGGLTFSQLSEDGTWFGFDCGHAGDFIRIEAPEENPSAKDAKLPDGSPLFPIIHPGHLWTVEDVAVEVEDLASQLQDIAECA